MNLSTTARTRHAVTALVICLLGLVGAVVTGAPAQAQAATLSGTCVPDSATGDPTVSWTLAPEPPAGATGYRLPEVTATPAATVDGIAPTADSGYPYGPGEALTGTQPVPAGATTAALAVLIEWDTGETAQAIGELDLTTSCQPPAPAAEIGQWSVGCQGLTITLDNSSGEDATLLLIPSTGDPVEVEVAGGESATVAFPAAPGLSVDIQRDGGSIVDPADPITVTAAEWAALACAEAADDDLPATGRPVWLIAAGAAALLALGAGLFLIARRRRIIFTA